jgi:predicted nucleic-acid-binding Zn-ribbon protein
MQDRKCSKCGSVNVYKSVGKNWHEEGVILQMTALGSFPALFQTEAFLCLDCRNLEIQVAETSTMYGKQRTLIDTVQTSNNWVKA